MYVFSDGSSITALTGAAPNEETGIVNSFYLEMDYDTNGYKKPNRMGRDVFIMSLYPYVEGYKKKKLVFGNHEQCGNGAHHYLLSRNSLVNSGCGTCNSNHSGYGFACGLLIQMDGWQIKNDYPW